ncbi:MAG: hypothetical protein H6553_04175 [Chitinophagales bacterium]|nr:hypothetical protein [Chitinophagales bacterium]MCB9033013.1 hypothetical protein [Chitinophagales bacterium]
MKKMILTALSIVTMLTSISAKQNNETSVYEGFQHPESVIAYKKHLFVSNTGQELEPLAKDGDGYITLLSRKDNTVIEEKFISGLNSPKGMFVKRGVLYVADIDKVVGFDIKTKEKVFEENLAQEGASYLNDVTKAPFGMYVSATLNDGFYKINNKGKVKEIQLKNDQLTGVNGISRRPLGKVFVANFGDDDQQGNVGKFGVVRKKYKTLKNGGINDGIVTKGKIYYTDWVTKTEDDGEIISMRRNGKKVRKNNIATNISGPSDIYVDKRQRVLWVPAMNENKIVAVPFSLL